MTPIIYNLNTVSLPLSGTGRYAVELIRSVGALRNNIVGIKGRQSYTGDQLVRVLEEMERPQVDSLSLDGFTLNNGALRLRKILRNIPYSRQAYDAYNQRALARKSQFWLAKEGRYHDLNYALDPRAGHLSTVYDLSNIVCPETHPRSRVKHLNEYFGRLSRSNSPIITISNTVKLELVTHYGINDSRIHVTPLAASEVYHPRSPEACQQILQQYSLDYKKYVLCVATSEPRKNLLRVLDAYESLDPQTRAEFPLVMVGASGWKSSALSKRIHRLQKVGSIRHLGFYRNMICPYCTPAHVSLFTRLCMKVSVYPFSKQCKVVVRALLPTSEPWLKCPLKMPYRLTPTKVKR